MSDTSIVSTSSYKNYNSEDIDDNNENSSCCAQYWFGIISSFLILVLIISAVLLIYYKNKYAERDRERQRIKNEFRRKHGVANKVLDMIMKDGFVYQWIKAHKGTIATTFKELFADIAETLFDD
ncbi:unnamed protein product [Adineta steineri]|uniref:Uncharacterized protein n=2 Tax=Adineta steineri TaxID=433720 RepID=A0A819FYC9_9BILA|nr:unnamed protein product [Adineta steineri]CAF3873293.1 unnamed protein product [Adineta steineri]